MRTRSMRADTRMTALIQKDAQPKRTANEAMRTDKPKRKEKEQKEREEKQRKYFYILKRAEQGMQRKLLGYFLIYIMDDYPE